MKIDSLSVKGYGLMMDPVYVFGLLIPTMSGVTILYWIEHVRENPLECLL